MRKLLIAVLVLFFVTCFSTGEASGLGEPDDNKPAAWAPFLPSGWEVEQTKEEKLEKLTVPFLHREFTGKKGQIATIQGKGVLFASDRSREKNQLLLKGKIRRLPKTGQLIHIELYSGKDMGLVTGQVSVEKAEETYRSASETYKGLPAIAPKLSFQEVLNKISARSIEQIEKAQRIEATYVLYFSANTQARHASLGS
jgi:hypothetical protein